MFPGTRRSVLLGVSAIIGAYLVYIRTRGISQTFWLLGDQILYWRIALRSWRALPIGGGPSSVGGTTIGPVFLWTVWVIRHVVGPWTGNLPHAGGIGLSIVQSLADTLLFVGIWRRFRSLALAVAVVLFVATAPYDMALTATIWNPPLAVAFVKFAIAIVLLAGDERSPRWTAAATATALLAVQAHSSAVFFAAPVIASFTVRELLARRWVAALRHAAASAAVVIVLEIPFVVSLATQPAEGRRPAVVVNNVVYTLRHPDSLSPAAAFRALTNGCEFILLRPWTLPGFATVFVVCAAVALWRVWRDVPLACATVAPLACAVGGFSFWRLQFDNYWFLTIAPSAALTVALALTVWPRTASAVAVVLAATVVAVHPIRMADSMTLHRLPEYGPLARGSVEIRRHVAQVRRIDTQFALPPSTDPNFLFEVLGGRVADDAAFVATIDPKGDVKFAAARQ